ncbi:hypothetical protein SKAU_G00251300 [Synaphobranchus kaupii]|uniref:Uncharacterized protein n=1 Tax=Synaphobranchus kaupii TaxID=118154 RepID=A0A9Q1IRW5_SYNKA|nr:hypothetical protein SKAU_G00251300 [Synaphobranchus kaupii]
MKRGVSRISPGAGEEPGAQHSTGLFRVKRHRNAPPRPELPNRRPVRAFHTFVWSHFTLDTKRRMNRQLRQDERLQTRQLSAPLILSPQSRQLCHLWKAVPFMGLHAGNRLLSSVHALDEKSIGGTMCVRHNDLFLQLRCLYRARVNDVTACSAAAGVRFSRLAHTVLRVE